MTPLRFNRVIVLDSNKSKIEKGTLNKMMPQSDLSYTYEIYGDSGNVYIVPEDQFIYITEDDNESEW